CLFLALVAPPIPLLFPYTTLFRSVCYCRRRDGVGARAARDAVRSSDHAQGGRRRVARVEPSFLPRRVGGLAGGDLRGGADRRRRSEEHTSELQSLTNLVCPLLLQK